MVVTRARFQRARLRHTGTFLCVIHQQQDLGLMVFAHVDLALSDSPAAGPCFNVFTYFFPNPYRFGQHKSTPRKWRLSPTPSPEPVEGEGVNHECDFPQEFTTLRLGRKRVTHFLVLGY